MTENTYNVAILGMGTVGSGTYKILTENSSEIEKRSAAHINIKKILIRDKNKKRNLNVSEEVFTDNFEDILNDSEIDIVIELMGGVEPAFDYIIRSIESGKHIVTANKEVMAKKGHAILKKAEACGVEVYFEASVAGGIPIIKAMKESLAANKVEQIMGIINGTTNYILTKMTKENLDFKEVLKEAQEKGYAEANPDSDVKGYDAAYKLAILSSIAFNTKVDIEKVHVEGITEITSEDIDYAKEMGYVIKLLAIGKENDKGIELRVHPTLLPEDHPLSTVNDVFNAIFVKGNAVGELMFFGRGAGDFPTGSAVVADIISIINNINTEKKNVKICSCYDDKIMINSDNFVSKYYIRLTVNERSGVLAKIAGIFAKYSVSLSSVVQRERGEIVPLVFITHSVQEKCVNQALEEIRQLEDIKGIENVIRVESN